MGAIFAFCVYFSLSSLLGWTISKARLLNVIRTIFLCDTLITRFVMMNVDEKYIFLFFIIILNLIFNTDSGKKIPSYLHPNLFTLNDSVSYLTKLSIAKSNTCKQIYRGKPESQTLAIRSVLCHSKNLSSNKIFPTFKWQAKHSHR